MVYRLTQIVVACTALVLLLFLVDWRKTTAALANADPGWILAAFLISVVGVLLSAAKWQGLLRHGGIRLPLAATTRLYWIGMFFSNFLPTSVGGDAVRLALTPARGRLANAAGSILIERLTGLFVMLALCVPALSLRPIFLEHVGLHDLLLAVVLALTFGTILLLLAPRFLAYSLPWLMRHAPCPLHRVMGVIHAASITIAEQASSTGALTRAILLSLPFYGTIILAQYAVLEAVGSTLSLSEVVLLAPIVPLLTILPLSINGLGLAEGVFVLLYSQAGVMPELALAAAVLRRLVDLANSALGGLFWLCQRPSRTANSASLADLKQAKLIENGQLL